MLQSIIDSLIDLYQSATTRELIATGIACVTSSWGLIETFVLKPERRKKYETQIERINIKMENASRQAKQSTAEIRNAQNSHMREMAVLQASHRQEMQTLRTQYENLRYQSAHDAGRKDLQLQQILEFIKGSQHASVQTPTPVAIVSDTKTVDDAVKNAEKATLEQPAVLPSELALHARDADPTPGHEALSELEPYDPNLPPKPNFPSYLSRPPEGYRGLHLVREVAIVDEQVVQNSMVRLQEHLRDFAPKDSPAAMHDRVTITGAGYTAETGNWVAFEGGKLDKFQIVLGSGLLIPGFEEQLVGVVPGMRKYVELTFPADYHAKQLASKPAVFQINVDAVERPVDAPLTDESVRALGFSGLAELKSVLRNGAERDIKTASDQRLKRQLLDRLDEKNVFEVPADVVKAEHDSLWRAQLTELKVRNLPIDALGKSPAEAKADLLPLANRRVRLGIVMSQLGSAAAADGYFVGEKDIDDAIAGRIAAAGESAEKVKAHFADPGNREALRGPLLEDKVTAWLFSISRIENRTVPAEDLLEELK